MIVNVSLPSGHLGMYPKVSLETEMTGEHHELFLSSPENLFERTVASVVGSLMKVGDVNKITFADLVYLFFHVRAVSISPVYKTEWLCRKEITPPGAPKQECGTKNQFALDLSKIDVKRVPSGMTYPKTEVKVPTEAGDIITNVFVRFLTVGDEFDVLDSLEASGISKAQLTTTANLYKFTRGRLLRALTFEDARVNDLTMDKKDELLKKLPFPVTTKLFAELKELDRFGPDLSPRTVVCHKCKGESRFSIPFSAQLILS